ncbi:hypothetical protein EXIGLDRAFT_726942 [Exidia glandulosa HHB12029]|uniref:Uncharacterized protein n=1 Tax=Exidia glandulosa HHB12029 TaxID=1314781 RepID=A0A165DIT2_EXIGL|nr:hypothetical protein EXIGLDRAFT_726942 [Exidia glandulosa HHB12029]
MFFSTAAVLALASSVLAAPMAEKSKRTSSVPDIFNQLHAFSTSSQTVSLTNEALVPFSFNNWGSLSSLSNFDSFFGAGNFDGRFNQIQVVNVQEVQVCSQVEIDIVQQNLAILLEAMKQVLLTQVCEVETQVIVSSQFSSHLQVFMEDVRHISGRQVGFDSSISSQLSSVLSSLGGNHVNLGFSGQSIGSNLQIVQSNFDSVNSPARIHAAWVASQLAVLPPSVLGF